MRLLRGVSCVVRAIHHPVPKSTYLLKRNRHSLNSHRLVDCDFHTATPFGELAIASIGAHLSSGSKTLIVASIGESVTTTGTVDGKSVVRFTTRDVLRLKCARESVLHVAAGIVIRSKETPILVRRRCLIQRHHSVWRVDNWGSCRCLGLICTCDVASRIDNRTFSEADSARY